MAIIDDFPAIAAELRRLRAAGRKVQQEDEEPASEDVQPRHPMRRTRAGELLYRRLVMRRRA